jgi:hypothetical protein
MVNGTSVGSVIATTMTGANNHAGLTLSQVIPLTAGDKLTVKYSNGTSNNATIVSGFFSAHRLS